MTERLLPPPDQLTDTEIYEELRRAAQEDEQALGRLFTGPVLALSARIERLVTDNPEVIRRAATEHPVFDLPYFQLPPDMELPLPPAEGIESYLKQYHATRDPELVQEEYFSWLEDSVRDRTEEELNEVLWDQYKKTYLTMKLGECSLRDVVFNSLRWYDSTREIHATEQYYFTNHLTERHPTSAYRFTPNYAVRVPMYPEMDIDSDRLAQATGIMVDLIVADPYFQLESDEIDAQQSELLLKRTLRAHDYERPQEVVKRSAVESLVRAILPMIIEGSRYTHASPADEPFARITADDIPTKLTRLAPLGYSGPATVYGVALEGNVTELQNDTLNFTAEARTHLAEMRKFANRHFHYPNLRNQNIAEAEGDELPLMLRTGLGCPVRFKGELPSPITAFTETLFLIYQILEGYQVDSEGIPDGYEPKAQRLYAQKLYEADTLSTVTGKDFDRIGQQMARSVLSSLVQR